MKKTFITIALALGMVLPASSQEVALPFMAFTQNSALLGTAGAGLVSDDALAFAAFDNAALPSLCSRKDMAALSYQHISSAKLNTAAFSLSERFFDRLGLSAAAVAGMYPETEQLNETGEPAGTFTPRYIQASLGASFRLFKGLALGADIKYASESLAPGYSIAAPAADLSVMLSSGKFRALTGLSNISAGVKASDGLVYPVPASLVIAGGYIQPLGHFQKIEAYADARYYMHGAVSVDMGAVYRLGSIVSARAGYHYGAGSVIPSFASAGLGIRVGRISLDAAYLCYSAAMDGSISMTLGVSL